MIQVQYIINYTILYKIYEHDISISNIVNFIKISLSLSFNNNFKKHQVQLCQIHPIYYIDIMLKIDGEILVVFNYR